jgi:hypothetical protein
MDELLPENFRMQGKAADVIGKHIRKYLSRRRTGERSSLGKICLHCFVWEG